MHMYVMWWYEQIATGSSETSVSGSRLGTPKKKLELGHFQNNAVKTKQVLAISNFCQNRFPRIPVSRN